MIVDLLHPLTLPITAPLTSAITAALGGGYAAIINDAGQLAPYVTFTRSSTATYYGSDGLLKTAAANEPRYDYDPATLQLRGLLIEEQRTNFYNSSNSYTAGTGTTVTASAAVSPDGTLTASRFAKTDATTPRYSNSPTTMTVSANTAYTVSRCFKYDGFDTTVSLEYNNADNWGAVSWVALFNVTSSGVTVNSQNSCTASVQNLGNGWYRAIATFTTAATIGSPTNPQTLTRITGASGVSVLMCHAQLEAGAFATSYIPTTTAAVTRATETAIISSLSSIGFNASEGTMLISADVLSVASVNPATLFSLYKDGSDSIRSWIWDGAKTTPRGTVVSAGVSVADITSSNISANTLFKTAVAFKANDFAFCVNSGSVGSDTAGAMPSGITGLSVGTYITSQHLNGHIRRLRYYPKRLSNAQLQALTT